ncbi:hypothetical protein BDV96DRAFT_303316 [Lophiotrema nucula]|uniref:Uncharacterized protein n=1 Tax=Lophiotrema nucula TaxID=690887 RepID=A0A6A5YJM3_9PLEO|nr:hypothetical protein BDV96DRAFT_303316 [Lophiotrema nucula]
MSGQPSPVSNSQINNGQEERQCPPSLAPSNPDLPVSAAQEQSTNFANNEGKDLEEQVDPLTTPADLPISDLPSGAETSGANAGPSKPTFAPGVDSNRNKVESSSSANSYSLSDPAARRSNPKLRRRPQEAQVAAQDSFIHDQLRSIMPSASSSSADAPQALDYQFCLTGHDGSRFSIISDAVPYLIGSDAYVEGLQELHRSRISEALLEGLVVRENVELAKLSAKDKAILTITALAGCSPTEETSYLLRNFGSVKRELSLWKDTGSNRPKKTLMNFQKLCRLIKDWQTVFSTEDPRISTRWRPILGDLWHHNIDVDYVSAATFSALLDATPETLPGLINQAQDAARTGSLADHKARMRALGIDDSFSYHAPESTDPNALYKNRFQHPPGHETNTGGAEKKDLTARQKTLKGCMAQTVRTLKWTVGITVGVGVVTTILLVMFFHLGQKPKGWNEQ